MRNTVINAIHAAAKENKDIVFITGDLGYSVIEQFQTELPDQFFNTGIAEQNMALMSIKDMGPPFTEGR